MTKELTPQQDLFLEYLFNDPECMRDTKKACVAAGYDLSYHHLLVKRLHDEILERTNHELALGAPKAAYKLLAAMDEDGSVPKAAERLKAIESVLDRAGLAKKQQIEVTSESAIPLFILPEKKEVIIDNAQYETIENA